MIDAMYGKPIDPLFDRFKTQNTNPRMHVWSEKQSFVIDKKYITSHRTTFSFQRDVRNTTTHCRTNRTIKLYVTFGFICPLVLFALWFYLPFGFTLGVIFLGAFNLPPFVEGLLAFCFAELLGVVPPFFASSVFASSAFEPSSLLRLFSLHLFSHHLF